MEAKGLDLSTHASAVEAYERVLMNADQQYAELNQIIRDLHVELQTMAERQAKILDLEFVRMSNIKVLMDYYKYMAEEDMSTEEKK